jgi:hypothetical protein
LVLILGLVSIAIGGVFVSQGVATKNLLVTALQPEKITLGIPSDKLAEGEIIDTAKEAQIAADTIREHRHTIAPTYGDLLAGSKHFDPTDPTQLTYTTALTLEDYLYLAVLGFGVTQVVIGSGVFMIIAGIAFGGTGLALLQGSKSPETATK